MAHFLFNKNLFFSGRDAFHLISYIFMKKNVGSTLLHLYFENKVIFLIQTTTDLYISDFLLEKSFLFMLLIKTNIDKKIIILILLV